MSELFGALWRDLWVDSPWRGLWEWYGVASGPSADALLLETGDYLLLETGDYLLLESDEGFTSPIFALRFMGV